MKTDTQANTRNESGQHAYMGTGRERWGSPKSPRHGDHTPGAAPRADAGVNACIAPLLATALRRAAANGIASIRACFSVACGRVSMKRAAEAASVPTLARDANEDRGPGPFIIAMARVCVRGVRCSFCARNLVVDT